LPNGELEHTRRAIQGFFVLRELKYTLLRKKDFRLPLKERYACLIPSVLAIWVLILVRVSCTFVRAEDTGG
jgi:hypothetical protein